MAQDLYFSDEELVAFRMAQVYENSLTTARIMSLLDDPSLVPGNYDFQHLQDVHKFIFQDFPKAWLEQNEQTAQFFDYLEPNVFQFEPGLLRSEKDAYNPTVKCREIQADNKTIGSNTHYSCMAESDKEHADQLLISMHPKTLQGLPENEVLGQLVDLYKELDFIHPFEEGNSRTLRTMTQLMAQEAGYELCWSKVNQNELYAARDLSLNEKAIHYYGEISKTTGEQFEFIDEAISNLQNLKNHDFKPMATVMLETEGLLQHYGVPSQEASNDSRLEF